MKFRTVCPGWLSPVPLACAIAMAAPAAQAQIQATATLSNLSVKVIDLNTADKIKPLATWGGDVFVQADGSSLPVSAVMGPTTGVLPEAPFSTGTYGGRRISLSTTLGDAALADATHLNGVYISNDSYLYTGRAINPATGLMTNYVDQIDSRYTYVSSTMGQTLSSGHVYGNAEGTPTLTLTLAPGTLATVSGDLLTSVTTDSRWLKSFAQAVGLNPDSVGEWGSAIANVRANFEFFLENVTVASNPNGGSSTSSNSDAMGLSASAQFNTAGVVGWDTDGVPDVMRASSEVKQGFSLVAQNWTNQDMVYNFYMTQAATVSIDGTERSYSQNRIWDLASGVPADVVTPPVTNIPEPGTWMLMGMGLGAVVWASRRRSQPAA